MFLFSDKMFEPLPPDHIRNDQMPYDLSSDPMSNHNNQIPPPTNQMPSNHIAPPPDHHIPPPSAHNDQLSPNHMPANNHHPLILSDMPSSDHRLIHEQQRHQHMDSDLISDEAMKTHEPFEMKPEAFLVEEKVSNIYYEWRGSGSSDFLPAGSVTFLTGSGSYL